MLNAVNYSTIRENLKAYCDLVSDKGDTVIVTRKNEKNVVIISMDEWNSLQRAVHNADYLAKIDRSLAEIRAGRGIRKTMEELEAMENE